MSRSRELCDILSDSPQKTPTTNPLNPLQRIGFFARDLTLLLQILLIPDFLPASVAVFVW